MEETIKKAMLEFLEPGMSLKFETILEAFANMAIETKRANFYITKNVKSQKWRVQLVGIRKSFIGNDLRKLVIEAAEYIHTNTQISEGEKFLNTKK